mmetsp:Transcript_40603/g.95591  ORF Transcript_40603/g.95591 Transcript_40603/m.95591 type:complete len:105 (-) Transcript_40603:338-652(-)
MFIATSSLPGRGSKVGVGFFGGSSSGFPDSPIGLRFGVEPGMGFMLGAEPSELAVGVRFEVGLGMEMDVRLKMWVEFTLAMPSPPLLSLSSLLLLLLLPPPTPM